ncbi:MAG: SpoIIE family protein phosphatase [Clostridia bacterium]|nr:SpoIIE family protein phosphatase [Clostridia bacterium]
MNREKGKIHMVEPEAQRRQVSAKGKNNLKTTKRAVAGAMNRIPSGKVAIGAEPRRAPAAPRFLRGNVYRASVRAERLVAASAPKGLVWLCVYLMGVVYARASLLFSAYPLGLGFMCASVKYFPLAAAGVFSGAVANGEAGIAYASVSVLLTSVRLIISMYGKGKERGGLFHIDPSVRMYMSALSAFACGLYGIIRNGYRYYDLFGSFLLVALTPLFTYLISSAASGECKKSKVFNTVACYAFVASLLYSTKDISALGISLSAVGAGIVTALAARKRGALYGTAAGTVLGLAGAPALMHVFSVFGFAVGLLGRLSSRAALLIALPIACISAYAVSGISGAALAFAGLVISSCVYLAVEYFGLLDVAGEALECSETVESKQAEQGCEQRFEALSESFRSLSEMCYALSDRYRRPDESELRGLCEDVCEKYCARCKGSPLCWNRDYSSTADIMGKVVFRLSEGKKITRGSLPTFFSSRCPSIDGIINEINRGCALITKKHLQSNRTEAFAMDYEAISALISRALEENLNENAINRRLTADARAACARYIGEAPLTVTGKRHLRIRASGFDVQNEAYSPQMVKKTLERICGVRLSEPKCALENGRATLSLTAVRRYGVQMSFLSRAKSNGSECGDCVSVFENREDYYYAMLSDGMGSGDEAALTSNVCSVFLKKMLSAGNAKDISIEMLNDLVRSSRGECSATVDLFELDMLTGKACFIKSGAAPSFVKRGGRLFRIQSKTLPIGIVRAADAEQVSYTAEHGDIIIMQSDGVAQSYEDCPWMANLLTRCWTDELATMCVRILDAAEANNKENDDRSVCILRIIEF